MVCSDRTHPQLSCHDADAGKIAKAIHLVYATRCTSIRSCTLCAVQSVQIQQLRLRGDARAVVVPPHTRVRITLSRASFASRRVRSGFVRRRRRFRRDRPRPARRDGRRRSSLGACARSAPRPRSVRRAQRPSPSPSPPPSPAAARAPYAVERGAESGGERERGADRGSILGSCCRTRSIDTRAAAECATRLPAGALFAPPSHARTLPPLTRVRANREPYRSLFLDSIWHRAFASAANEKKGGLGLALP